MPDYDELNADFDLLLRSALTTYADPGPDSDLADRILVRIAATEAAPAPYRRWLPWAVAVPVASGLLLLLVLSGHGPIQRPSDRAGQAPLAHQPLIATTSPEPSTTLLPSPAQRVKSPAPQLRRRLAAVAVKNSPLPKLDVFPTPRPLTPEERTFIVFVAQAPETERQSLIDAQKQAIVPLSIAAIEIQPLDPPDHGGD